MRAIIWWFVVFAAYLVTVASPVDGEVVAAAIIAVLCTIIIIAIWAASDPGVRVPWAYVRLLAGVPSRMVHDVFRVSGRILWSVRTGQPLRGYIERVEHRPAHGDLEQGREAIEILSVCAAPNTIVVEVDPRGALVVHRLVAGEAE